VRDVSLPWRLFESYRGSDMKKSAFAACPRIRDVVLCSVITLGLVACGSGGSGSSATASVPSGSIPSLVQPNVGVIARPPAVTTTTPTTPTPVASNNGPPTNPTPPPKPTTGSATLDWMPPTENSDGTILSNLAGYTVYYGTSPGNLTQSVKITNPGLTAYTMTNLPSGTWYFAVTAYSSAGTESSRTATVSTTI
jgi:hypothetical protein